MTRRALVISLGAALALLVLWFLLLWGPQGGRLTEARERVDAAETQNQGLELRVARLRSAQERAPDLVARLEDLRRAVPDEPELAQFILDANEAATRSGVEFLSISPGVPSAGTGGLPPVINLAINVSGGYFEVLDYLDRLERLPRVVVVDALDLTPTQSDTGGEGLAVSINARMFATSAPQIPTTTTVPVTTTTTAGSGG